VCVRREVDQRTIHTHREISWGNDLQAHYLPQITIDLLYNIHTKIYRRFTSTIVILKIYLIITYT
jgi:hypothetical protein